MMMFKSAVRYWYNTINLIRADDIIQIILTSPPVAKFLYKESSEKSRRADDSLSGVQLSKLSD